MIRPIFSQSVDDAGSHVVDLDIRPSIDGFILNMIDSSDDGEYDSDIEMYLTRENLQLVIDRLTKALE
jgi:hypothetical protein